MEEPILKFSQICLQATDKCSINNHITNLIVTTDDKIIFSTLNGEIYVSSIYGSNRFELPKFDQIITYISINNIGNYILISFKDGTISLYQTNDIKPIFTKKHNKSIISCALDPEFNKEKKFLFHLWMKKVLYL